MIPLLRCELFRANYPSKMFEAMAMECPIILSSEGYSRKLLKKAKAGIMPAEIHRPGNIGIVSRSGTLTYEAVDQVTRQGLGQSTVVGIGGDPVHGLSLLDAVSLFKADPETGAIVMIGEIGGSEEEEAADYITDSVSKPVAAYVAGASAPEGKRMGHAGAIMRGNSGTWRSKVDALERSGACIVTDVCSIGEVAAGLLS